MPQIANGDGGAATRALINSVLPRAVPFSETPPLDGRAIMAAQAVAGALAFRPPDDPQAGADCIVRLTADGGNAPSFAGFMEHGGSAGWLNTAGMLNLVRFWHDGVSSWYAVSHPLDLVPLVMQSALVANGAPDRIVVGFDRTLDGRRVPAASAFTLVNSGGTDAVTAVAVAGSTVTLTKSRATRPGDQLQLAYAPPAQNALADGNGNPVSACALRVTNGIAPAANFLRLGSLSNLAETANSGGGFDYAESNAAGYGATAGKGISAATLPAGADGWAEYTLNGAVEGGPIFGLIASATFADYPALNYAAFVSNRRLFYLAGGAAQPTSEQPASIAAGHRLRIDRSGGAVTLRWSTDGGSTYAELHRFAGTSSDALHVAAMIGSTDQAAKLIQPRAAANVA